MYRAGWLRNGILSPVQLGTASYLVETPERPILTEYWDLVCTDQLDTAIDHARDSGLDDLQAAISKWFTCYPGRPEYFTHWLRNFGSVRPARRQIVRVEAIVLAH